MNMGSKTLCIALVDIYTAIYISQQNPAKTLMAWSTKGNSIKFWFITEKKLKEIWNYYLRQGVSYGPMDISIEIWTNPLTFRPLGSRY